MHFYMFTKNRMLQKPLNEAVYQEHNVVFFTWSSYKYIKLELVLVVRIFQQSPKHCSIQPYIFSADVWLFLTLGCFLLVRVSKTSGCWQAFHFSLSYPHGNTQSSWKMRKVQVVVFFFLSWGLIGLSGMFSSVGNVPTPFGPLNELCVV